MQSLVLGLESENKPAELEIWNKLEHLLQNEQGIVGYKNPSIGIGDKEDIPTFIIRSSKFGLILLDVVNEKIKNMVDEEYWVCSNGHEIYSRDRIVSQFNEELINRLKKDKKRLYKRVSLNSPLLFVDIKLVYILCQY